MLERPMPLKLIHGPPNSGRAGLIRERFVAVLNREPVLVVPTVDDVFHFERELCAGGATLGGAVTTFAGLFQTVATASGSPPAPMLTEVQRLRAIEVAIEERRGRLGPLRHSASRTGFAPALDRLLDELQGAGLDPEAVEASAGTLEGSAYLGDVATLFAGYTEVCDRLNRTDRHGIAREAIALLRGEAGASAKRPVFLYGFDDLTHNQLELIEALAARGEVTVTIPFEEGNAALTARAGLLEKLRERIGVDEETCREADPGNTDNPLLFGLERGFGVGGAAQKPAEGLTLLRSAGERGEAEATAAAVARLLHDGAKADEIAIALRDPGRRGHLLARVLESSGVPVALEAELPVVATGVGGALLALLEAEYGTRRAVDVLRWMRGPAGAGAGSTDWLERSIRRRRAQAAAEALELWLERHEDLPYDLRKLREAGPAELVAEAGEIARRMAARFLDGSEDGPSPGPGDGTELRAAAAISRALAELSELGTLVPGPAELIPFLRELSFRIWSGPIEGRVRIADPQHLRAWRFDHVVIGSLQDGEFPRRGGGDPFLSEAQRGALGLDPRRDTDAEERYLFYACLSLPRKSLFLSYRDSDENGAAEARSPLLDDVRQLLDPPPDGEASDPVEESITRGRDLAQVVNRVGEAASEDALARSVAVDSRGGGAVLDAAAAEPETRARIEARLAAAQRTEDAAREPGPLRNPAVLESLRAVSAYGGTTLEGFDVCSYRWFVDHELQPRPLDPTPDPLIQGGIMHEVLYRLYREQPGADPQPRPSSLAIWIERAQDLVAEVVAERGLGDRPAERAIRRGVERLLVRFLGEESDRSGGVFQPWLLEAKFGEDEDCEQPALEIDGWRLHGAIDRTDRAPDGRALVHDYKVASRAPAAKKLEEEAKLQLQLYLLAVGELWGAAPSGAVYHPLRATKDRRPRGLVLDEDAEDLGSLGLVGTDVLPREEFDLLLEEARRRAGRIVARMRDGEISRDPGPRVGLRNHDVCPTYCDFAPICRRDRAPVAEEDREPEDR
jgi:ATP-dependent helicase/DNAse subunit B